MFNKLLDKVLGRGKDKSYHSTDIGGDIKRLLDNMNSLLAEIHSFGGYDGFILWDLCKGMSCNTVDKPPSICREYMKRKCLLRALGDDGCKVLLHFMDCYYREDYIRALVCYTELEEIVRGLHAQD